MARTYRRDYYTEVPAKGFVMFGVAISTEPDAKELRKAHSDKKKWYKPSKKAKQTLSKGKKAKKRAALRKVVEDPDGAPLPKEPRSHKWDYL